MNRSDRETLRELAKRYVDICTCDVQAERRSLWRAHNSFVRTRPLIYTRAFAWHEMPESRCRCEDALARRYENELRHALFWNSLNDDSIFEPWLSVEATHVSPPEGVWGMRTGWIGEEDYRTAKLIDPPMKDYEDVNRLIEPHHAIDEAATRQHFEQMHEALGDILPVYIERAPLYRDWNGDISTQLARLRGLDAMMMDMMVAPEWTHRVLALMRDGILRAQEEAERAGDWTLSAHSNQAMPYARELGDPAIHGEPVTRDKLWYFCASQETTLYGPDQFEEFMLQYQIPIMAPFGLVAYGCCEDLTRKIDKVRKIPNLRRIAVSPMADVKQCAEQLGDECVFSYRPSPSDMVGYDFDEDRIRRILRRDLEACRENGCHVDITLKDVETVQNDSRRVRRWVKITREVVDEFSWT